MHSFTGKSSDISTNTRFFRKPWNDCFFSGLFGQFLVLTNCVLQTVAFEKQKTSETKIQKAGSKMTFSSHSYVWATVGHSLFMSVCRQTWRPSSSTSCARISCWLRVPLRDWETDLQPYDCGTHSFCEMTFFWNEVCLRTEFAVTKTILKAMSTHQSQHLLVPRSMGIAHQPWHFLPQLPRLMGSGNATLWACLSCIWGRCWFCSLQRQDLLRG